MYILIFTITIPKDMSSIKLYDNIPDSSFSEKWPGNRMFPGAELAAVREVHRTEFGEGELL